MSSGLLTTVDCMKALGDPIPQPMVGPSFTSIKVTGQPHELDPLFVRFACIAAASSTPGSGALETRRHTNLRHATLSMRSSVEEGSMKNEGEVKVAFLGNLSR